MAIAVNTGETMEKTDAARKVRATSERDIAIAILVTLAQDTRFHEFSLMGFYDEDAEAIQAMADRLGLPSHSKPFLNKLRKVTRTLVQYGVLSARMRGTHKEYLGEPAKQTNYRLEAGRAHRMKGKNEHYHEPEWEAGFILRHAYPKPEE